MQELLNLLAGLGSVIEALVEAVEGGTPHDKLLAAIKRAMVEASDERMREEME